VRRNCQSLAMSIPHDAAGRFFFRSEASAKKEDPHGSHRNAIQRNVQ
jgi:hypothetical protein